MDYYDEVETGKEFKSDIKTEIPDNPLEQPGNNSKLKKFIT